MLLRLKTDLVPVEGLHSCSDLSCQKVVPKYKYVCVCKSVRIQLGNSLQIIPKVLIYGREYFVSELIRSIKCYRALSAELLIVIPY